LEQHLHEAGKESKETISHVSRGFKTGGCYLKGEAAFRLPGNLDIKVNPGVRGDLHLGLLGSPLRICPCISHLAIH